MTAVAERPVISEGSPEEWLTEQYLTFELRESTQFIEDMKAAADAMYAKDRNQQQLERERREREDAEQEARREEIWLENQYEAEKLAAQSCSTCFCIHAGEC